MTELWLDRACVHNTTAGVYSTLFTIYGSNLVIDSSYGFLKTLLLAITSMLTTNSCISLIFRIHPHVKIGHPSWKMSKTKLMQPSKHSLKNWYTRSTFFLIATFSVISRITYNVWRNRKTWVLAHWLLLSLFWLTRWTLKYQVLIDEDWARLKS